MCAREASYTGAGDASMSKYVVEVIAGDKGGGEVGVRYGGEGPDHGPRVCVDDETRDAGVKGEHG